MRPMCRIQQWVYRRQIPRAAARRSCSSAAPQSELVFLLGKLFAQVFIFHERGAEPEREDDANRPGNHDSPEYPVRKAQHELQTFFGLTIAVDVTIGHGVRHRAEPGSKYNKGFASRAAQDGIIGGRGHLYSLETAGMDLRGGSGVVRVSNSVA